MIGLVVAAAAVGWMARGGATLTPSSPEAFAIERSSEALELPAVDSGPRRSANAERDEPSSDLLPLVPLSWARFPDAPFEAVADSPAIAVDTTVVTVGAEDGQLVLGQADLSGFPGVGGIEARASRVWNVLPPAPLRARSDPYLAVIAPDRILVWGGSANVEGRRSDGGSALHDGAVLHLDTGEWDELPPFPTPLDGARTAGWVGDRLVVVGMEEPSSAVAYGWSPGSEEWQLLASPPVDVMRTLDGVVTGDRMLIYGVKWGAGVMQSQLFTLGYQPARDEWRAYDYVPLERLNKTVVVPTYPGFVLMWGRPSTNDFDPRPDGLTLSTETGRWGQIGHPGRLDGQAPTVMEEQSQLSATFTGESVVIAGGPGTHMLIYNLEIDRWAALAPPEVTTGGALAFADGRLVRWGGEVGGSPVPQLWVFPANG